MISKEEKVARRKHMQKKFNEIYGKLVLSKKELRSRIDAFEIGFLVGYIYKQDLEIGSMEDKLTNLSGNNTSTSESK